MSVHQMVMAWQEPNLTPAQRLVLLALADCADREGRNAFRSERTIAEHTQLAMRTVKLCLKFLRDQRKISIQELPTNRRSTTYQLHLTGGANDAPQATDRRGAWNAPLEVILGVQKSTPWGAKSDRAYKEEPVLEPVEPTGVVRLLTKATDEIIGSNPTISDVQLMAAVGRWAMARRMPADLETVCAAVSRARAGRGAA